MYNVYLVNNPYSYGELSIFVPFLLLREKHAEVIYSYFRHFSDQSFIYHQFSQFSNMCCLFHFSHNILRQSKYTIEFLLRYRSKEHPSFAISWSLGNIKHMFMYINNLRLSTLIIYIVCICWR